MQAHTCTSRRRAQSKTLRFVQFPLMPGNRLSQCRIFTSAMPASVMQRLHRNYCCFVIWKRGMHFFPSTWKHVPWRENTPFCQKLSCTRNLSHYVPGPCLAPAGERPHTELISPRSAFLQGRGPQKEKVRRVHWRGSTAHTRQLNTHAIERISVRKPVDIGTYRENLY